MKSLKFKSLRVGKYSKRQVRLGSPLSAVAIAIITIVKLIAEEQGLEGALWVEIMLWGGFALLAGDLCYSLLKLSPRKRWHSVMVMGLVLGSVLTILSLVAYYVDHEYRQSMQMGTIGLFCLLLPGLGGWLLYRRSLRRLQSLILERKYNRKRRYL